MKVLRIPFSMQILSLVFVVLEELSRLRTNLITTSVAYTSFYFALNFLSMSLSRMLAGSKRDSPVFEISILTKVGQQADLHAKYQTVKKDGICGTNIAGKNTSNMVTLVAQVLRLHKEAQQTYIEK